MVIWQRLKLLECYRTLNRPIWFCKTANKTIAKVANVDLAAINYHFDGRDGLASSSVNGSSCPLSRWTILTRTCWKYTTTPPKKNWVYYLKLYYISWSKKMFGMAKFLFMNCFQIFPTFIKFYWIIWYEKIFSYSKAWLALCYELRWNWSVKVFTRYLSVTTLQMLIIAV